jgi:CrcB protein
LHSWAAVLLVALGSAGGGIARYAFSGLIDSRSSGGFPWGTLAVNLSGSFLIGSVSALAVGNVVGVSEPAIQLLFVAGFLGSYTSVSTFSLQTLDALRAGLHGRALLYVFGSVAGCLAAAAAGWAAIEGVAECLAAVG